MRQLGRPAMPPGLELSNSEHGLRGEQDRTGWPGAAVGEVMDGPLVLLGGGVSERGRAVRRGCEPVRKRGRRRRIISCSS